MRRRGLFLKEGAPSVRKHGGSHPPSAPCGQRSPEREPHGNDTEATGAKGERDELGSTLPTYSAIPEQPCRTKNRSHGKHHIEQCKLPDVTAIIVPYENWKDHHERTNE